MGYSNFTKLFFHQKNILIHLGIGQKTEQIFEIKNELVSIRFSVALPFVLLVMRRAVFHGLVMW